MGAGQLAIKCASTADLADVLPDLSGIVKSDGAAVVIAGKIISSGTAPTDDGIAALAHWLESRGETRLFATSGLGSVHETARDYADVASGMLAIPISRVPGDYLFYFRKEASRPVTWAGQPHKLSIPTVDGERLGPRKSFAAWQEIVRGQSVPWSEADVRIAEGLRTTVLDVILRMTDAADRDRRATQAHQEPPGAQHPEPDPGAGDAEPRRVRDP
jgi:light-regulated signal transduction histidine kinase (bacteriophytochrome)